MNNDIETALRTFIKSGSANGKEELRRKCLSLVPTFSAAPDLLAACEAVAGVFEGYDDVPIYARKCIAAIAKAKGNHE